MPVSYKKPTNILIGVALATAAYIVYWPYAIDDDPSHYHAAAILVVAITFWSTHKLPEHVTALILMLGAVLLSVAPPSTAFSGFGSGGTWLIFGGLIIGAATPILRWISVSWTLFFSGLSLVMAERLQP